MSKTIRMLQIPIVLIFCAAPTAVPALSQDLCATCPTAGASANVVIIDARNPDVPTMKRFGKRDLVKVILTNKNPYLFRYQLTKTENAVKETALSSFISLFGPFVAGQVPSEAKTPGKGEGSAGPPDTGCKPPVPEERALATDIFTLQSDIDATVGNVDLLGKDSAKAASVLKDKVENTVTGLKSRLADCQTLCRRTTELANDTVFMSFPPLDPAEVGRSLNDVPAKIHVLRQLIADYRGRFKDPKCQPGDLLKKALQKADDTEKRLADDSKTVAKAAELAKTIKPWQVAVSAVLVDPTALTEQFTFGNVEQTTDLAIKVTTQPVDKPDKPTDLVAFTLRFGQGPFFTVSGGLAYAHVTKPQFKPTQGFERVRGGGLVEPEVVTRVIGTSESAAPVSPMVMLNGRLWQGDLLSVHLSLGVTAKYVDSSTDIEYLVGPSISMLDDQLFMTVGGYAWRRQRLQADLFVGQKIADTVTDLPVSKVTQWGIGFGLTYKIK